MRPHGDNLDQMLTPMLILCQTVFKISYPLSLAQVMLGRGDG